MKIFALSLLSAFYCTASSQAAVIFNSGAIRATATTSYGVDMTATLTSGSITAADGLATFQVSFDITPTGGTQIVSNANSFWGVDDPSFSGTEAITSIGNLQVVNFNANGGSLTVGDVTNLSFDFVTYTGATNATDTGFITANGDTGNWTDMNGGSDFIGHVSGGNGVGGVQLIGDGTNSLTGDASVTSFNLGATGTSTAWRIENISVTGMTAVPEPSSLILTSLGVCLFAFRRSRKEV